MTDNECEPTFVADVMLGRLARSLRMLGYDVLYSDKASDPELKLIAARESRTLLTRDRELAASRLPGSAILVESDYLEDQLRQVINELALPVNRRLFTRCLLCNALVEPVPKADVRDLVPAYVFDTQENFARCPSCGRIYWAATHVQRAREWLTRILESGRSSGEDHTA